jgi:hypothetical protein
MPRIEKRQVKTNPGSLQLVTLTDMKRYLLESGSDRDDDITALIQYAQGYLEAELEYAIDTDELIYQYHDRWDWWMPIWHRYVIGTDLVVEHLVDGVWTAVSSSLYRLDPSCVPPRVILRDGAEWPDNTDEELASIRIGFKVDTGHPAWNSFKQAVREIVARTYESPEGFSQSASMGNSVQRIIDIYKIH